MARTGFNIYVVNRIAYVPTERVTRHGVRMGSEPVSATPVQDMLRLKETVLQVTVTVH